MELIASPGTAIHTCQYKCKAITEDTCGKNVNVNGLYFYKNWLQVKLVIVALLHLDRNLGNSADHQQ